MTDPVLERIWTQVQQQKSNATGDGNVNVNGNGNGNGNGSDGGALVPLSNHMKTGYTTDEASQVREWVHKDAFNVVPPPVDCPAWLCIILPCITHLKSMKAHKNCIPEDAEVLRNGKWIRYDAASLVVGDCIRLVEGDIVPADCVIALDAEEDDEDLLVDLRVVTGQSRPKQLNRDNTTTRNQRTLLFGGSVVQGRATALVTAIGPETVLGQLIKTGKFPVPEKDCDENEETMMMDDDANMRSMEMGTLS
eukprot:CAMPEP_0172388560 /NCGR_PEP_ID=MMETSP1061-20121228/5632_1 /TAXON_ID=37318 /ORGANISM="Pseudo-nitzschia pungens, Strain cf. pungens" /LENGTH=249 /DNA_ID=CAMNT_0013118481 /DNA_START=117 /DNA_END=866 /DNA_ORIENTATION=-